MTTVELRRAPDVGAIARRMTFLLDGRPVARLRRGGTARIEVAAGRHVVQVRMDWLRSAPREFELAEGASVTVTGAITEHAMTFTGTFLQPGTALDLAVGKISS